MTGFRRHAVSLALALLGALLLLASAGLDLAGWGAPGVGRVQILGIATGLAAMTAGHVLARARADGLAARDAPWLIAVVTLLLALPLVLHSLSRSPVAETDDDPATPRLQERLLEVESAVLAPQRGGGACRPADDDPVPPVRLEPVVDGLRKPVHVTHAGDGSGRLFVVEKGGAIRIVRRGRLLDSPFLDIRERVVSDDRPPASWEQGLFSVAFPPDFADSGRFYVHYTAVPDGRIIVARYAVSADPDRADPDSEEVILQIPKVGTDHNGGQLRFGPDGFLYVGIGDGAGWGWPVDTVVAYGEAAVEFADGEPVIPPGSGFTEDDIVKDDPWNTAQDLGSLMGKILRLDVAGGGAYQVPPDNPFVGRPGARPEIWAYGFRNPWRFSFDPCDGALFAGDVGRSQWEEIDLVDPGGNYGWKRMEGAHCYPPDTPCDPAGLRFPIAEYSHGVGEQAAGAAVVGGHVYRGRRIPALQGRYLFADFLSGRLWALTPTPGTASGWRMEELARLDFPPSSFGLDADGEPYVVGYQGVIYRLVAGPSRGRSIREPRRNGS